MFKNFSIKVAALILLGLVGGDAFSDGEFFRTKLSQVWVQSFLPSGDAWIDSLSLHTTGDTVLLQAHAGNEAEDIIKTTYSGLSLQGYVPPVGSYLTGFKAIESGDSAILKAVTNTGEEGAILITKLSGAAIQSCSCNTGLVIKRFITFEAPTEPWVYLKIECGTPTGVEEKREAGTKKQDTRLEVYPNPFTTVLSVQCSVVSEKQKITLQIYDLSGRLVKTLITNHSSLTTAVSWDGTDRFGRKVASGVYFLRLESKKARTGEKIVVVR